MLTALPVLHVLQTAQAAPAARDERGEVSVAASVDKNGALAVLVLDDCPACPSAKAVRIPAWVQRLRVAPVR